MPEFWGSANHSEDYDIYFGGEDSFDEVIDIGEEHGISTIADNLSDPVVRRVRKKVRGRWMDREIQMRNAQKLSMTATILIPPRASTPVLEWGKRNDGCKRHFFAVKNCANPGEGHAYIWEGATANPPTRVNDFRPIGENTIADMQMETRLEEELTIFEIAAYAKATEASDTELYDITFLPVDCANCGDTDHANLLVVGGDGTLAGVIAKSTDRLGTLATKSVNAPAGSIYNSIAADGSVVLVGFADDVPVTGLATAAAGGVEVSTDGGETWVLDAGTGGITKPVWGVARFGSMWLAAGGATGAAPLLAYSTNGTTWTDITHANLPSTEAILAIAVDQENEVAYFGTEAGKLFKMTYEAGAWSISQVTIPGSPTAIYKIAVTNANRLMIGGASGYLAVSIDGGDNWTQPAVSTTDAIQALAGHRHREIFASSQSIQARDILTMFNFNGLDIHDASLTTENFTAVAVNQLDDMDVFAAVNDAGMTFLIKSANPFR